MSDSVELRYRRSSERNHPCLSRTLSYPKERDMPDWSLCLVIAIARYSVAVYLYTKLTFLILRFILILVLKKPPLFVVCT